MPDEFCMRFNNATQRIFGSSVRPIVLVWETNDRETPWYAQARLLGSDGKKRVLKFDQVSAAKKQKAKDMAAKSGLEWLQSRYPLIDLGGV
ncbi:hypothetical protein EST38_g4399 [Candolleomyces aberdarensis]|uniref:DRBM domain-containing protein n=1 Tax=Candolleomyces aberdarensis TaxID=2316362 RepID=A0A4Q2DPS6_9AGAR|nr:hypothetical protein EST38_g4399 [Candolleomyces aberdarensis]